MKHSIFYLLCLILLSGLTAALPSGCEGELGIISTNSSSLPLLWTCSSIDPSPLFGSGQNFLLATYVTSSDVECADYCAPWGPIAAIWYPNTTDCECWEIGDITGNTVYEDNGATWIDFYLGINIEARSPAKKSSATATINSLTTTTTSKLSSKINSVAKSTVTSTSKSSSKTSSSKKSTVTSTSKASSTTSSSTKVDFTSTTKSSSSKSTVTSTSKSASSSTKANVTSTSKSSSTKATVTSTSKASSTTSTSTKVDSTSTTKSSSSKSTVTSSSKSSSTTSSSTKADFTSTSKSSSTKVTVTSTSKSSSSKISVYASTFSSSKIGTSTSTSSAAASTFTGATANNITTSPTCYQLPVPLAGLSEIPYNVTQSDSSILPLVFYVSQSGQTLNYLGSMINGTSVLYDVTNSGQVAIFVDYQPIVLFTPNGMSIFGPNCSWAAEINIPNFYSQLQTISAINGTTAQRKHDFKLPERQAPPGFPALLTLQPDCYSTTFPTPPSNQVSLLVGQSGNIVPCTYIASSGPDSLGVLGLEYNCIPPGATLSQANCESAAVSGLQTLQTNSAVQKVISTSQSIDKGINQVISWLPNKVGGSIGPVDMSWIVQQAVNNFVKKITPPGLGVPLNGISQIDNLGTVIDSLTPNDAASACGGLSSALYNIYLEFTQNSIGPPMQQLMSLNLASTTLVMIQAPLWVNPRMGKFRLDAGKQALANLVPVHSVLRLQCAPRDHACSPPRSVHPVSAARRGHHIVWIRRLVLPVNIAKAEDSDGTGELLDKSVEFHGELESLLATGATRGVSQ